MATGTQDVEVSGDRQLEAAFLFLENHIDNLREPLLGAAEVLQHAVVGQFGSEGAYLGTPWAPLDPDYAARKTAQWGPQPILVASGKLKRELTSKAAVQAITDTHLEWGSSEPIAGYHQDGTEHMPARPIMVITPEVDADIDLVFFAWLGRRIEEAGL